MQTSLVRVFHWIRTASRTAPRTESVLLILIVTFLAAGATTQSGLDVVVNMIPRSLSFEQKANHEPFLAVHPTTPNVLVATAHNVARGFCKAETHAPLLFSVNGGTKWWVICAVTAREGNNVLDGSVQFSAAGDALFAGTLQWRAAEPGDETLDDVVDTYIMGLRQTDLPSDNWTSILDYLGSWPEPDDPSPMNILHHSKHTDQPILATAPGGEWEVVAAGANDFHQWSFTDASCRSGTVILSTSPFTKDSFKEHCIAQRESIGRTPAVRAAVHPDGTVYAVFYRPVVDGNKVDVVVVRAERDALSSAAPFDVLLDRPDTDTDATAAGTSAADCSRRDGKTGIRVARCVENPIAPASDNFGQERRMQSQLSIAVHPTDPQRVYIAWADLIPGSSPPRLQLHVQFSTNSGDTWSDPNRAVVPNATNPSLAVAENGSVGLLYQRLRGGSCPGTSGRWATMLDLFDDHLNPLTTRTIASTLACKPEGVGAPYVGDYLKLHAVHNSFFGVFSASNDLATSQFPLGKTFQRMHAGTQLKNGLGGNVEVSIDPYFFRIR